MYATYLSEKVIYTYKFTLPYNPEEKQRHWLVGFTNRDKDLNNVLDTFRLILNRSKTVSISEAGRLKRVKLVQVLQVICSFRDIYLQ